ncbi:DUF1801 domain-containing protein [soil metagenome]
MTPSESIDQQITSISDWRGALLTNLRKLIHEADPEITEEWKWDVPVFTHKGMVCAISAFKDHVKINFFKGAQLSDPHKLINNGFTSKAHRSIDFSENDTLNESGLKELIKEAVSLNTK